MWTSVESHSDGILKNSVFCPEETLDDRIRTAEDHHEHYSFRIDPHTGTV